MDFNVHWHPSKFFDTKSCFFFFFFPHPKRGHGRPGVCGNGMAFGQSDGVDTRDGVDGRETPLSNQAETRLVSEDKFMCTLWRGRLLSGAKGSTYSTQTGLTRVVIAMGTACPARWFENATRVLTMMTSRTFWKSFLRPSVALQNRAKFPSRSCRTKRLTSNSAAQKLLLAVRPKRPPTRLWLDTQHYMVLLRTVSKHPTFRVR